MQIKIRKRPIHPASESPDCKPKLMLKNLRLKLRVLILGVFVLGHAMAHGASTPEATVADLHQALLGIMQSGAQLGFSGRLEQITPVVENSFDFDSIARVAMGRHWQQMSESQQQRSNQLLRKLTVNSYADRFSGYSGESFKLLAVKDGRRGQQIVRTELVRVKDEPVQLDYILKQYNGQWRIINVLANGVSDLSLKRAEYGSIISKQGSAALLQQIEAQIKRLYPES